MSKHRSLNKSLRKRLLELEGVPRKEALECLGVVEIPELETQMAGRAARESLMHTEFFPAVTA